MRSFFVIDDDDDDTELFCEALYDICSDISCHCEQSGEKALLRITDHTFKIPDMIFLDVNMPAMSGWDVLTRIRELKDYETVPVVMCSTSAYSISLEGLRATNFFIKPPDFKELKSGLELILRHLENDTLASMNTFE